MVGQIRGCSPLGRTFLARNVKNESVSTLHEFRNNPIRQILPTCHKSIVAK